MQVYITLPTDITFKEDSYFVGVTEVQRQEYVQCNVRKIIISVKHPGSQCSLDRFRWHYL